MDAAVDAKKQVVGLAVVIRDWERNCVAAAINTTRFFGNVAMAQAATIE